MHDIDWCHVTAMSLLGGLVGALTAGALMLILAGDVQAACEAYPVTEHSPTGIVGCEVYGEGTASRWQGPGVARNDCVYPWTGCTPITITSVETGLSISVIPQMYCDCYTGTPDERIVDLDPASVAALGLDPDQGLYPVLVVASTHAESSIVLPDTSMALRSDPRLLAMYLGGAVLMGAGVAWLLYATGRKRAAAPTDFARWMNGDLTVACGREMHYLCQGTISTIGIEASCRCKCHGAER